jgi:hypothetical protein
MDRSSSELRQSAFIMAEVPRVRGASDQRSGCLTVLWVVLGLLALMAVTFGVGTCMFLRSETGQKVVRTAREGITMAREATTAPGTAQLRDRGCEVAMVMAFNRIFDVLKEISPEAAEEAKSETMGGSGTLVMCQVPRGSNSAPDCSEVAQIYSSAVPEPPERFGVMVQDSGGREPRCQGIYAPDGTFLEPLNRNGRTAPRSTPTDPPAPPAPGTPAGMPPEQPVEAPGP